MSFSSAQSEAHTSEFDNSIACSCKAIARSLLDSIGHTHFVAVRSEYENLVEVIALLVEVAALQRYRDRGANDKPARGANIGIAYPDARAGCQELDPGGFDAFRAQRRCYSTRGDIRYSSQLHVF